MKRLDIAREILIFKSSNFGPKRYTIFGCPTLRSILGRYMEENFQKNITTYPKILSIKKISQKKKKNQFKLSFFLMGRALGNCVTIV